MTRITFTVNSCVSRSPAAGALAAGSDAEKAAQFVKSHVDNICKWHVDDSVEAKDKTGRWYRSTVRGVRCVLGGGAGG